MSSADSIVGTKQNGQGSASPLFILCPIRSFSSVVCAMLGQHPEMYSFPELRLFNADTIDGILHYHDKMMTGDEVTRRDSRDAVIAHHVLFFKLHEQRQGPPRFSDGLLRTVAELCFGSQTTAAVEQADAWLVARGDWSVRDVYDVLLEAIQPRIGVDKSPHTGMSTDAMERVHRLYPHARFLHLTRHPVMTQKSMHQFLETAFRKTYPDGDPRNLVAHCAPLARQSSNHPGFYPPFAVSTDNARPGEDLLSDPKTHLLPISQWLGLRSDPQAIESMMHPECSPYAKSGPSTAHFGNDPKFLAEPQLRQTTLPPTLETPARWGLDAELQQNIIVLAKQLGYEQTNSER